MRIVTVSTSPGWEQGLSGFEDDVRVLDRIGTADQPDRAGDSLLESGMRLKRDGEWGKRFFELGANRFGIGRSKFFGHESSTNLEIGKHGANHIKHGWDIVSERDVDRFHLWPERKAAISNDQRVRMPDTTEERIDGRIEDAGFQHAPFPVLQVFENSGKLLRSLRNLEDISVVAGLLCGCLKVQSSIVTRKCHLGFGS
jgi:hypothetical protein